MDTEIPNERMALNVNTSSDHLIDTPINIQITSEIDPLKAVLLKRPSKELNNLTPELLDQLLFDDIPFLEGAQREHDAFKDKLIDLGAKVFYLDDLVGDVLNDRAFNQEFIRQFLKLSNIKTPKLMDALLDYLGQYSGKTLCQKLMIGLKKNELSFNDVSLSGQINKTDLFWLKPIPNLYFTRDPATSFARMVSINKMHTKTRQREGLFYELIFKYHPKYKHTKLLDMNKAKASIEGGDILVLNETTLAIGISQRTDAQAIEYLCYQLFHNKDYQDHHKINKVLAFHIPSSRAFMHLDTVLTQVDVDKLTMHQGVAEKTNIYKLTPAKNKGISSQALEGSIEAILTQELGQKIQLIYCGGDDRITGSREQWSDGVNTLAVRPGEVLVYQRNKKTNQILEKLGITVHTIPCSELSRGRGGPRCMSMPLVRSS